MKQRRGGNKHGETMDGSVNEGMLSMAGANNLFGLRPGAMGRTGKAKKGSQSTKLLRPQSAKLRRVKATSTGRPKSANARAVLRTAKHDEVLSMRKSLRPKSPEETRPKKMTRPESAKLARRSLNKIARPQSAVPLRKDVVRPPWIKVSTVAKIANRPPCKFVTSARPTLVERLATQSKRTPVSNKKLSKKTVVEQQSVHMPVTSNIQEPELFVEESSRPPTRQESIVKREFTPEERVAAKVLQMHIRVYLGRRRRRKRKKKRRVLDSFETEQKRRDKEMKEAMGRVKNATRELFQYKDDIKKTNKENDSLNEEISRLEEEIKKYRVIVGDVDAAQKNDRSIGKKLETEKKRVDSTYAILHNLRTKNDGVRKKIDELRLNRLVLKRTLAAEETKAKNFAEEQKRLDAIIEKQKKQTEKYKEKKKSIEFMATKKKKEFDDAMAALEGKRAEKEEEEKKLPRGKTAFINSLLKEEDDGDSLDAAVSSTTSTRVLSESSLREQWNLEMRRTENKVQTLRLKSFGDAFELIKEATGVKTLDEMVETFSAIEEENFHNFNTLRATMLEGTELLEKITQKKADLEALEQRNEEANAPRKRIINRLEKVEKKAKVHEEKLAEKKKRMFETMTIIRAGLMKIADKLDIDDTPPEMLGMVTGASKSVGEMSEMELLLVIESKVIELQTRQEEAEKKDGKRKNIPQKGVGPSAPRGTAFKSISKRSIDTSYLTSLKKDGQTGDMPLDVNAHRDKLLGSVNDDVEQHEQATEQLFKLLNKHKITTK